MNKKKIVQEYTKSYAAIRTIIIVTMNKQHLLACYHVISFLLLEHIVIVAKPKQGNPRAIIMS